MTNVMLKGSKEIGMLAVNPISGEKFHIEVRVAIGKGFQLRLIDTQTKSGRKHRRGMDTLNEIKFSHQTIVRAIKEIFGGSEYKKVLVVWAVEEEIVIEKAKNSMELKFGKCQTYLAKLIREVKTKPTETP